MASDLTSHNVRYLLVSEWGKPVHFSSPHEEMRIATAIKNTNGRANVRESINVCNPVTIRNKKINPGATTASTQEQSDLELLIHIDNALIRCRR
jgi:hypothetical protein